MVEVNSETDFVAKNEQFQGFVRDVAQVALAGSITDIDALNAAAYPGGATVAEQLTQNIATIGENQSLRRSAIVTVNSGVVTGDVHNDAAPSMGKRSEERRVGHECVSRRRSRRSPYHYIK